MTLHAIESQRLGLARESVRGTAEASPVKWYPTRGMAEINYNLQHLEDNGLRGVAAKFAPVSGIKVGEAKIPLNLDPQMAGEFLYSLLGAVSSAESETITIGASNNKLDFDIGGGELTATIASDDYVIGTTSSESSTLCAAIKAAMESADGTGTYTVSYSRSTKLFTIARSSSTFSILWKTGTNGSDGTGNTIGSTLGFSEAADDSAAASHVGDSQIEYAFAHTFTRSGIQPPAYTLFLDRGLNVLKYNLACVKKIAFKSGVDDLAEMDVEMLFKTEASGSIGSPSFPTQRYLSFQHVDFKIAGSSNTDVKEWNLTIDNTARAHRTLALSQDLNDVIAPNKLMVEGGFTVYFQNTTERDKFIANTAVVIRVLVEGSTIAGSHKYGLDLNVYEAHYKAFPYGEDQGLLAAKATFEGFYSTSDSKVIDAILKNQVVSYTA